MACSYVRAGAVLARHVRFFLVFVPATFSMILLVVEKRAKTAKCRSVRLLMDLFDILMW